MMWLHCWVSLQGQWKHLSTTTSSTTTISTLTQWRYLIWLCKTFTALCNAGHRPSVSTQPSGAQWRSLTHQGPQWKKWCFKQNSALNRERSLLFRLFFFLFLLESLHTCGEMGVKSTIMLTIPAKLLPRMQFNEKKIVTWRSSYS